MTPNLGAKVHHWCQSDTEAGPFCYYVINTWFQSGSAIMEPIGAKMGFGMLIAAPQLGMNIA